MPELTPEPDSTGGENQKKKKLTGCFHVDCRPITLFLIQPPITYIFFTLKLLIRFHHCWLASEKNKNEKFKGE
jgi:hypothetical protein